MIHLGWFSNAPKQTLRSRCSQPAGTLEYQYSGCRNPGGILHFDKLGMFVAIWGEIITFHLQHKGQGLAELISSTYFQAHENNNPNSGFWRYKNVNPMQRQENLQSIFIAWLVFLFKTSEKLTNSGILSLGVFFITCNSLFSHWYLEKEE